MTAELCAFSPSPLSSEEPSGINELRWAFIVCRELEKWREEKEKSQQ